MWYVHLLFQLHGLPFDHQLRFQSSMVSLFLPHIDLAVGDPPPRSSRPRWPKLLTESFPPSIRPTHLHSVLRCSKPYHLQVAKFRVEVSPSSCHSSASKFNDPFFFPFTALIAKSFSPALIGRAPAPSLTTAPRALAPLPFASCKSPKTASSSPIPPLREPWRKVGSPPCLLASCVPFPPGARKANLGFLSYPNLP